MNKELIKPIAERIELGHSKSAIKKEVVESGYPETEFEEAYKAAQASASAPKKAGTAAAGSSQPSAPASSAASTASSSSGSSSNGGHRLHLTLISTIIVVLVCIIGGIVGTVFYLKNTSISDPFADGAYEEWQSTLSEEQISDLVAPSVVRIEAHFEGELTFSRFDVDFDTFDFYLEEDAEPITQPFDVRTSGSGFIVGSDGSIVTNAHVVFPETVRQQIFDQWITGEMFEQQSEMSMEEAIASNERLEEMMMDDDGGMQRDILEFLIENSELEYTAEISIIDPQGSGETFNARMDESIPADVVAFDDSFILNDRDVALVDVDETDLPALRVNDSGLPSVGDRVYAFGFPGSADISNTSYSKPTFTRGTISSLKDSQNGSFTMLQTDAKLSSGSSGGPLVNETGEVAGVVTQSTAVMQGDNFAFAIPSNVLDQLSGYRVADQDPQFQDSLLRGMFLVEHKHCEQALDVLPSLDTLNETFSAAEVVEKYTNECNELIENGNSIDTRWDQVVNEFKGLDRIVVAVSAISVVSAIAVLLLISIVIRLIIQVRRNRRRIRDNTQNRSRNSR